VLLSLVAHGAFLSFLLLSLPDAPPPPPPAIQVELVPPPLVSPVPQRATVQADRAATPAARAGAAPMQPRLLQRQDVTPVYAPPAPVAPRPAPSPAQDLPPGPARPAPPPAAGSDDARDRLGAVLRSTGCRNWNLSAAERERCLEREGALAREGAADIERSERRARNEEAEVARRPANATALVRPPGDDPRNHTLGGPPPVMVGVVIPFGKPPKAIEPIAPSTLRGDDDALRPKPRGN
jgi:hypothetical protein